MEIVFDVNEAPQYRAVARIDKLQKSGLSVLKRRRHSFADNKQFKRPAGIRLSAFQESGQVFMI